MEESNKDSNGINRRKVLQTAGTTTMSGLLISGVASASNSEGEKIQYEGIAFDTLTLKVQNQASAVVKSKKDGITGSLKLPWVTLPLNDAKYTRAENGTEKLVGKFENKKVISTKTLNDLDTDPTVPLKLVLERSGYQVYGYVTRPSRDYGKLGFTLANPDDGHTIHKITRSLPNQGNGRNIEGIEEDLEVVDRGVPQNSAMHKIAKRRAKQ